MIGSSSWRILEGDCREVLRGLADCCVHTVVTSPPYFGLRDYGTGKWDGGDPDCDHQPVGRGDRGERANRTPAPGRGGVFRGLVAIRNGREYIGIELNPEYAELARERIATDIRLGHRPPKRAPEQPQEQGSLFDG